MQQRLRALACPQTLGALFCLDCYRTPSYFSHFCRRQIAANVSVPLLAHAAAPIAKDPSRDAVHMQSVVTRAVVALAVAGEAVQLAVRLDSSGGVIPAARIAARNCST
jgi:hypothetical protein